MVESKYRLALGDLMAILEAWNRYLKRTVHLIACGGTAMTLAGVKDSTKDVDFIVPELKEYDYLVKRLKALDYVQVTGYGWQRRGEPFQFDLFPGHKVYTAGLLVSPLEEGRHTTFKEFSHLFVGILNDYDLISTKLFRGAGVDYDDCLALVKAHRMEIDVLRLVAHFNEMAGYDVSEERVKRNLEIFISMLREGGLYDK
jgi:hypothetical protein